MTEKEKMVNGKLYNASDKELLKERQRAKEILLGFNSLRPSEIKRRDDIIRGLLGKVGEHFCIEPPFRCDYGYNISIGENFYANYNCTILDCAEVIIGDNVMLGPNASIFTAGHPIDFKIRSKGLEYALPVTIGSNVWIGGGVIINPGVTIGDNVVIGSGSVVTRKIPAGAVAVGNPCKVIREI